jgi:hypothetical protein
MRVRSRLPWDLHLYVRRICQLEATPVLDAGEQAWRWWVAAKRKLYPAEDFADLPPLRRRRTYRHYRKREALGRIRLTPATPLEADAILATAELVSEASRASRRRISP